MPLVRRRASCWETIGCSMSSVRWRSWTLRAGPATSTSSRRIRIGFASALKNSALSVWSCGDGLPIRYSHLRSGTSWLPEAGLMNLACAPKGLGDVVADVRIPDMTMEIGAGDQFGRLMPRSAYEQRATRVAKNPGELLEGAQPCRV